MYLARTSPPAPVGLAALLQTQHPRLGYPGYSAHPWVQLIGNALAWSAMSACILMSCNRGKLKIIASDGNRENWAQKSVLDTVLDMAEL